jgi:hypothetical protein
MRDMEFRRMGNELTRMRNRITELEAQFAVSAVNTKSLYQALANQTLVSPETNELTLTNPDAGVDQTLNASGGAGAEQINASKNFSCVDGIFAATTVKIGSTTISEVSTQLQSSGGWRARDTQIHSDITGSFGAGVDWIGFDSHGDPSALGAASELVHYKATMTTPSQVNNPHIYGLFIEMDSDTTSTGNLRCIHALGFGKEVHIGDQDWAIYSKTGNNKFDGTSLFVGATTHSTSIQVAGGAVITTLGDTAALANSDVKVPTNTTVKEYVDGGTATYQNYHWFNPTMLTHSGAAGSMGAPTDLGGNIGSQIVHAGVISEAR